MPAGHRYGFGTFRLETGRHLLLHDGQPVRLTPKTFDLLVFLVENRERLVTKPELMDRLWPDQFVDESNLPQTVYELRRALGVEPGGSRYVETVPRRGYRFVADVRVSVQDAEEVEEGRAESPEMAGPSLPGRRGLSLWAAAGVVAAIAGGLAAWTGWVARDEAPEIAGAVRLLQDLRTLSTSAGNHSQATFSPDGRSIAFVNDVSGTPQIWIRSLSGGDPVQVTSGEHAAARPRWSVRDEIVFAREGDGIWAVPALGGEARQITAAGFNPGVSPDGRLVVYEQQGWLLTVDADGGEPRRLVRRRGLRFVWSMPAFSPDGQWIAYFTPTAGPGRGDIWIVPVDGGDPRRLTDGQLEAGAPAWSPDGREIIFWSRHGGSQSLWAVPASGGEPRPLTSGAGDDDHPAISPDGGTIVFTNTRNRYVLTALDPASGAERALLDRHQLTWVPQVSPDGSRIAFFHPAGAHFHVFTVGIDGEGLRQVTRGEGINIQPRWSSDGRSLFYYQQHPENAYLRIPSRGGEPELIRQGWTWGRESFAVPSPDERRIAYVRNNGRGRTTMIWDRESDRHHALPGPGLDGLQWSLDGRFVLGSTVGAEHVLSPDNAIRLCPADGGACSTVASGHGLVLPHFSADGRAIYFVRPLDPDTPADAFELGARWALWRIGLDGSDERQVAVLGPFGRSAPTFTITPDHQVIYPRFEPGRNELWTGRLNTDGASQGESPSEAPSWRTAR
jgi:Tol biopolymer transport system component/DNA-binding winged helix-turn-helix (wHTH) protein